MADWLLVPVDDPDGCAGCGACCLVLVALALLFGGGAAAGVSKLKKRKQ